MHRTLIFLGGWFVASFLPFLCTSGVSAQEALASEKDLNKFNEFTNSNRFYAMVRGEKQPTGKADQELIELASEYYVFSMTLAQLQRNPNHLLHKRREVELRNFHGLIRDMMSPRHVNDNKAFRTQFSKELIKRFTKVFGLKFNDNQISIVNAGLMLPIFAELQQKESADYFASLVEKKGTSDVIKLFAFKAQQVYFAKRPIRINQFEEDKVRLQFAKQIDPIINYVITPPAKLKEMSHAEKEAHRYIRCEAIKALAETKIPWIPLLPKLGQKKPQGAKAPVAYTFLRVLATGKDGLSPTPSLSEKIAAVEGLCQIDATRTLVLDQKPYYNPDPAVKVVGQAILQFANEYRKDYLVFKNDKKLPPQLPWKSTGEALQRSLRQFRNHVAAGSKAHERIGQIAQEAEKIFDQTKLGRSVENPVALRNLVAMFPQPNPVIYRGFDKYKITAP